MLAIPAVLLAPYGNYWEGLQLSNLALEVTKSITRKTIGWRARPTRVYLQVEVCFVVVHVFMFLSIFPKTEAPLEGL